MKILKIKKEILNIFHQMKEISNKTMLQSKFKMEIKSLTSINMSSIQEDQTEEIDI